MNEKIYTREELEKLAAENPNELALLFAQKVVGDKYAIASTWEDSRDVQIMKNKAYQSAQGMLTDWTAVINAGKKIAWDRAVQKDDLPTYWAWKGNQELIHKIGLHEKPNWPDCAALMIVMIEVMQK